MIQKIGMPYIEIARMRLAAAQSSVPIRVPLNAVMSSFMSL